MSDEQNPAKRTTKSGIAVGNEANDLGLTATVALSRKGMGLSKRKEAAPPPPPPDKTSGLPYSVATDDDVGCPRCKSEFQVSSEFYDAVAECPECALMFVIKAPGTPPYRGPVPGATPASNSLEPDDMMNTIEMNRNAPAPAAAPRAAAPRPARTTTSGIDVDKGAPQDYGLTATVTLSRRGMGMHQKRKGEIVAPPAATQGKPYSVATADSVSCPKCQASFDISPEFYNAIAECPECSTEFVIKPPGTPPPPRSGSRPVVTDAAGSGPVSVPPSARPAPPQRAPRPAAPPPASAPASAPARKSAPKAASKAAPKQASAVAKADAPKRRTETSIKNLEQLTQAPAKKKSSQGIVMAVIGGVIVLMIVIVIFLVVSLMK